MGTILIVDDNKQNLQVLGNLLHENHYKVAMAKDGPSALQIVKKVNPDLIVLDIMMPDMDGFEVCQKLKADRDTRDIPIIFLTAKTDSEDIVKGFVLGGVDYITKPFKKEELVVRIKNHVDLIQSKKRVLAQAQELEAANALKDKVFGIIAHDLRDALGSFKEFTTIMTESNVDFEPEEMEELLNFMKEKAGTTFELLENLLWWSRSQRNKLQPRLEPIDIEEVIFTIAAQYQDWAKGKQIKLHMKLQEDLRIIGDADHIKTVIKNLIVNAIKFTSKGGEVTLKTETKDDNVRFVVTDNGVGIAPEKMPALFDQYIHYSTYGTNNEKGSGIGLILCQQLLALNNGTIGAESELEKGSKFFVDFSTNIE
ncbi:hybrid sensor histidine kinase/response regulator [Prolixibacteraceae bacterium JC049]|nr:hybrid sensor histidine kinase/response regulator [Prolixibacteraceae bacterium JC049]